MSFNMELDFEERKQIGSDLEAPKTMASLHDEIIQCHILKYFGYMYMMNRLTRVCKRWMWICKNTRSVTKHLKFDNSNYIDLPENIEIIRRHQPSIISLDSNELDLSKFAIPCMISASQKLDTLILRGRRLKIINGLKLKGITTLAVDKDFCLENTVEDLLQLLPDLKRMQYFIHDLFNISTSPLLNKLEEAILFFDYDPVPSWHEKVCIQRLIMINPNHQIFEKRFNVVHTYDSSNLSYELYFRYFGTTNFVELIKEKRYQEAAKMIGVQTTIELEKYLYEEMEYQFPTIILKKLPKPISNFGSVCRGDIAEEPYDLFVQSNMVQIPDKLKLSSLVSMNRVDEALEVLVTMDQKTLASVWIREAFFDILSKPSITRDTFADPNVSKVARIIVNDEKFMSERRTISAVEFNKISHLKDDWSFVEARTDSYELYRAMVDAGCTIVSIRKLVENARFSHQFQQALDQVALKNHSNMIAVLLHYPLTQVQQLLERYKVTPQIEDQTGTTLFNHWIIQTKTPGELSPFKENINYCGSNGYTPLMTALKCRKPFSFVHELLRLGADPTIHPGNRPSPLGIELAQPSDQYVNINYAMDIVNLLVEYGADVNAPCMFEERMCSPLMIALKRRNHIRVIRLLIVLGANTKYVDELGDSVSDLLETAKAFNCK